MAQEAEFVLATGLLGPDACHEPHRVLCPPVILQRANSSKIYTCAGTAILQCIINDLSEQRFMLIRECPDNCSSTDRKKSSSFS